MMRLLRGLLEAFRGAAVDLARRPLFSVLSIAAMTVAMVVLASFLLLSRGARATFGELADQAAVEVYLAPEAAPADIERVAARVAADPAVLRVVRVTREQALGELQRLYPDLGDIGQVLGDNPLPASLRVTPRSPDPATLAGLVRATRTDPAVMSVRYDREWLASLSRIGEALRLFAVTGSLVLFLSALVTIGAVVRLALDDKLDEVSLLRLVGAPFSFVIAPVLLGGGLLGGAGATAALGLVALGRGFVLRWAADTPLDAIARAALGANLPLGPMAVLLLVGIVTGILSAAVAAGRTAWRA